MAEKSNPSIKASPEQFLYARILEKGMFIGLITLLVTFALYTLGIMKPYIPLNELSNYWPHGVTEYLHTANVETGWSWVKMLGYGDFVNFIGIVILAGVTVICYLSIVPTLWRNKDKVYALLAVLEAVILCVAASGILGSGGH